MTLKKCHNNEVSYIQFKKFAVSPAYIFQSLEWFNNGSTHSFSFPSPSLSLHRGPPNPPNLQTLQGTNAFPMCFLLIQLSLFELATELQQQLLQGLRICSTGHSWRGIGRITSPSLPPKLILIFFLASPYFPWVLKGKFISYLIRNSNNRS